jgi:dTDP-4-dehydrorhamnose reductase
MTQHTRQAQARATSAAVTGAHGRLGRALVGALGARGLSAIAWTRPDYDLDDALSADRLVARDRTDIVIHTAAWTDVDGCAREPELAIRRNATAAGELARACAHTGTKLVLISTNEVFDGERTDGHGYTEDDAPRPINPYGQSKLAGEMAALAAYRAASFEEGLWIVRTAWLYGRPGNDFPMKILAAADRLGPGEPLKVVADEVGSPTYTVDLADAILELVTRAPAGLYHLAGAGAASRFEVAAAVLAARGRNVPLLPISRADFVRASVPPAWAVLDCARAASLGVALRPWPDAVNEYLTRQ